VGKSSSNHRGKCNYSFRCTLPAFARIIANTERHQHLSDFRELLSRETFVIYFRKSIESSDIYSQTLHYSGRLLRSFTNENFEVDVEEINVCIWNKAQNDLKLRTFRTKRRNRVCLPESYQSYNSQNVMTVTFDT